MDTKKLRQKILDLAIRGKLVPQDPNDEPASVLLERIRAKKEHLIKEGKIKRSRNIIDTVEIEVPFEVPESWEWTTIGGVCEVARGGSPRPIKDYLTNADDGINWIKIGDTEKDGKYINSAQERIKPDGKSKSRYVRKGDFLLTNSMSFGHPYILNIDGCIHDGWLVISPIGNAFTADFLYYLLSSDFVYEQFSKAASGGVVSNLNSDKVADTIIPIPPTVEQIRIVLAIKQWFDLIDILENEKSDLQASIQQAKSKILNLAIHGKLVPQDPKDEPAIELLKRINPEFEGCEKVEVDDLPDGWAFCRLENIVDYEQPQAYIVQSTEYSSKYKTPVLTAGKSFIIGYTKEEEGICSRLPVIIFDDFTTESKYVDFPFKVKSSAMKILHVKEGVNIQYVCYFMSITRLIGDTHKRYWISEYSKITIPLPPYQEQLRIVAKIEELFSVLDSIKESLA